MGGCQGCGNSGSCDNEGTDQPDPDDGKWGDEIDNCDGDCDGDCGDDCSC